MQSVASRNLQRISHVFFLSCCQRGISEFASTGGKDVGRRAGVNNNQLGFYSILCKIKPPSFRFKNVENIPAKKAGF